MIDPEREAETVVAGERTSTPVSGKVVDGNRAFAGRGIAVCALIVFGAFFIWGGWGRAKTGNEDRATKPVVSLRTPYEAPRDPEPPARSQAVQEAALMPVIRPPAVQPARSPGDELLDSARRAPVLVYNRPARNSPPAAPEASGPDGFMTAALPYSYGQPEPRNELADKLKATPLEGVRAARLPNRHLVVTQGTAIPCVLETAMSSDVAGFARNVPGIVWCERMPVYLCRDLIAASKLPYTR